MQYCDGCLVCGVIMPSQRIYTSCNLLDTMGKNQEDQKGNASGSDKNKFVQIYKRRHNLLLATCFYSISLVSVNALLWIVAWNKTYNCL